MKQIALFSMFFLLKTAVFAQSYTSYFTGDTANVNVTTKGGVCLMGGATESDDAMRWFLQQAGGGDIVVIRSTCSYGYNAYLYSHLGAAVNSVESIVINSTAAANDPYVIRRIREADGLWLAGGDQADYVNFWKNSPMRDAINYLILQKKAVVGGTSAGMAILGGAYFSAVAGSVTSAEALTNPYNNFMTVGYGDFINYPLLKNVICDTHFDARDRRGRLVAFMARLMKDREIRPFGIACDEYVAVCVDSVGVGRVFGKVGHNAYFIQTNCVAATNAPENCTSGVNLTWYRNGEALKTYAVEANTEGSSTFNLTNWKTATGGVWQNWSVQNGLFSTPTAAPNAPNCSTTGAVDLPFPDVKIFPNPTSEFLNFDNLQRAATVEIQDINGRVLQRKELTINNLRLDVSSLDPSVYWLVLREKDVARAFRFCKF